MTGQIGQFAMRSRAAAAIRRGCPEGSIYATTPSLQRYLLSLGLTESPKNCFSRILYTRTVPAKPKPKAAPKQYKTKSGYIVTAREKETLRLINQVRARYGRSPLVLNKRLMAASRRHSLFMRNTGRVGHILSGQPDGAYPQDRAHRWGYKGRIGENVAEYAKGYTPAEVVQAWVHSPGHFRTMLNPEWRVLGIGDAYTAWTTMFGTLRDGLEVKGTGLGITAPYGPYGFGGYQAYGVPGWPNYYGYADAYYFPAKAWRRPPDIQDLYKERPIPVDEVKKYCKNMAAPYCAKFPGDTYCNTYNPYCAKFISGS